MQMFMRTSGRYVNDTRECFQPSSFTKTLADPVIP